MPVGDWGEDVSEYSTSPKPPGAAMRPAIWAAQTRRLRLRPARQEWRKKRRECRVG